MKVRDGGGHMCSSSRDLTNRSHNFDFHFGIIIITEYLIQQGITFKHLFSNCTDNRSYTCLHVHVPQ